MATTKAQISAHLRESEELNQHIRDDKENAQQRLRKLRAQISQAGATAHAHLVTLTCQCSATLRTLREVVEKVSRAAPSGDVPRVQCPVVPSQLPFPVSPPQAQRILRLAEMCRRLETEEEKVLPFYPSSLTEEEKQNARRVLEGVPNELLAKVRRHHHGD